MLSGVGEGMESEDSNAGKKRAFISNININKNYPVGKTDWLGWAQSAHTTFDDKLAQDCKHKEIK